MTNEVTAKLSEAMAMAFGEIDAAIKGAENAAFKQGGRLSKYADISSVISAIKPALIKHGLFFVQPCQPSEDGVTISTVLYHKSGESLSLGSLYVPANKRDAQGFGSALTYARRYALVSAFGVPTEDDDGNAAVARISQVTKEVNEVSPTRSTGVALSGPYKSMTALEAAARKFVSSMRNLESQAEWKALRKESAGLIAQLQRDHPGWWGGWEGQPDGFTPICDRIAALDDGE